ncbi:glycosyltransferase [Pleomorphochaeta sp. DL1XJH-081]|uniref:glycosyltransferase n=1 Tax=Pleomorphochaeta sp. DL1XJH-081 TaxID=3409690 RepID=UPI003BB71EE9
MEFLVERDPQLVVKPRVLVFIYNEGNVSGITTSMRAIQKSWLKEKYDFQEIYINEKLGSIVRIKLIMKLVKRIRFIQPDIIHVSGLGLHGFYAVLSARIAGYTQILTTVHGATIDMIQYPRIKKWMFVNIIEPLTLRLSKVVNTVCIDMANKAIIKKNTKSSQMSVIYNVAPKIDFLKLQKNAIKRELGLSSTDILVVYTGRITDEKGIQYALDGFSDLNDSNLYFALCGSGKDLDLYKNKYKNIIKSGRVFFLGNREDVLQILYGSDIFLFPTLHENLSNSLLEACSIGLAIIATNVGGNPEVIIDGFNGILVPPFNSTRIRDSLISLARNRNLRYQMGNAAQKVSREKFSPEIIYAQIDRQYKTLIQ